MSRSERLLLLLQALRRYRLPVSAAQLAGELHVSVRTVYRDIESLIAQGAQIEGAAGLGFILRPGFLLPPLMLTDEETEALVLGTRWVATRADDALAKAARDLLAKITAVLPENRRLGVDSTGVMPGPPPPRAPERVGISALRDAIRRETKLHIRYCDEKGSETSRTIWPVALAFAEQSRILPAWCETRTGFRHFGVDRILELTTTGEPLPRPRRLLLREWRTAIHIPDHV